MLKSAPQAAQKASDTASDEALIAQMAKDRVAIEAVSPEIDGGRFAAKSIVGHPVRLEADVFGEGHDMVSAAIWFRKAGETDWREAPLHQLQNDRWAGTFIPDEVGPFEYTVVAWRNVWGMWRSEVSKKHAAGVSIALELEEGARLLADAATSNRGTKEERNALAALAKTMAGADDAARFSAMMTDETAALVARAGRRQNVSLYHRVLRLTVDRRKAAFSAWYEMLPRSHSGDVHRHGTFDDVIAKLPYVQSLGFDVLYFPPIHPIGLTNRKGKNNSLTAEPGDVGSPYAIGSEDGGHMALHPQLGDFDDFKRLVAAAHKHGLEIALDYALNCSPDHPWIKQHHDWFEWRPDGSIRYAENPPKKYEDIVNVRFYDGDDPIPAVWIEQREVFRFWIKHGVKIFRIDNPHTKAFAFWEWVNADINRDHPDVLFLSEAFTRPKVMQRLAKLGFHQSYSYFTWRNTKAEFAQYLQELTQTDQRHSMRVNFFVNTPDINPYYLQSGSRAAHQARLVLAATTTGNYGVYNGFEICEATPIPGKEEYLNSEKYELKAWDFDRPGNIKADIQLMNRLRHAHPALQAPHNIAFYNMWNDNILYYGRYTDDRSSFLLFAVNLDPNQGQGANFEVPLWELGLPDNASIEVHDLVSDYSLVWHGKIQQVYIDPAQRPYFIWKLVTPRGAQ